MAQGKKSFVLYCDLIHTIDKLPDDKAGQLFKHILSYVNDLNPTADDLIINIAFEPIKQQLKRDLDKWETEIKPKRSEAGRLGGLKSGEARRSKMKQNEANASTVKQNEANEAVNVNVNVNVNEKDNDINSRKLKFASTLEPYLAKLGRDTLNEFYAYWTEPNKSNTRFRYEMEKTWDLERRLSTWVKNQKPLNFSSNQQQKTADRYK